MSSHVEEPAPLPNADLIFVLAGLEARKLFGLRLFGQGIAPRILLSVDRFEIRKLSRLNLPAPLDLLEIAARVPPPLRHYFVWFEGGQAHAELIPVGRFGTWAEIESLARWLKERSNIRSMIVVSSVHHMARIRICCRTFLPPQLMVSWVPLPEMEEPQEGHGPGEMLAEWIKIPAYHILSRFYRTKRDARDTQLG